MTDRGTKGEAVSGRLVLEFKFLLAFCSVDLQSVAVVSESDESSSYGTSPMFLAAFFKFGLDNPLPPDAAFVTVRTIVAAAAIAVLAAPLTIPNLFAAGFIEDPKLIIRGLFSTLALFPLGLLLIFNAGLALTGLALTPWDV